eukprot:gene12680-13981_t
MKVFCVFMLCLLLIISSDIHAKERRKPKRNKVHRHLWGIKPTTCCACGSATYRLKFLGKWTNTRHPKHHPGRFAYFSSLIGASHANDFVLWRIGHLASSGIRKMSEFGSYADLQREIRLNGARIKSSIQTLPIPSCCKSGKTSFKTDRYRHLFSAMSRLTPSPDWNVGVDSLDLCDHENCKWKKKIELDLQPWDAGTDSGITYMAPNQETTPAELIHYITQRKDLHSRSSFYTKGGKVPPLAKMVLRLVDTEGKCTKESQTSPTPSLKVGISPGSCDVSVWTTWTSCSVSCGLGTRVRGRVMMNSGSKQLCPRLQEITSCNMGKCGRAGPRKMSIDCRMSKWSSWTACSVKCGRGKMVKTRSIVQFPRYNGKACRPTARFKNCYIPCPRGNYFDIRPVF